MIRLKLLPMNRIIYALLLIVAITFSCTKDKGVFQIASVHVQLVYPEEGKVSPTDSVKINLASETGKAYEAYTDASGACMFEVPFGLYSATVAEERVVDEVHIYRYNTLKKNIEIQSETITLDLDLTETYLGSTNTLVNVAFRLVYPEDHNFISLENVEVLLYTNEDTLIASTNIEGVAVFSAAPGIYSVFAEDKYIANGYVFNYTGSANGIEINESEQTGTAKEIALIETVSGQIIIKELYVGGCQKDDGSDDYHFDKYVLLYNNSSETATVDNLCLGITIPYNSSVTNADYVDGKPFYEIEGWTPAGQAFWYFQSSISLEPGEQIVVALNGAIDHTQTYSNSVNLANENYYCTYDMEIFSHTSYYPSPSALIPTANYLKAYVYGTGTAWPISVSSPAFFIFSPQDITVEEFGTGTNNLNSYNYSTTQVRKKVPNEWIYDGIEVFRANYDNYKRLPESIDAGFVVFKNGYGYTLYRNVDKEATEALSENEGKIKYNYSDGTEIDGVTSTDPSGIDAEASIANGARIIYKDINNSTEDFHQRKKASIKE